MVGIITFHRAINYGAVLQTYALQKALGKIEIDSEILDYRSETIEGLYNPFKPFLHNIKSLEVVPKYIKKKRFDEFVNKHLKLSPECKTKEELIEIQNKYEAFVTGSDQVWCIKCLNQDKSYFLDFVKDSSKKFSYAASIGKADLSDEEKKEYESLINDYCGISVREKSAKSILSENCISKDINVNIDPTLLLNSEDWDCIRSRNVETEPYILLYTVMGQYHVIEQAKKLSKKTGMKIIYLNDTMRHKEDGIVYKKAVSPQDFVAYFAEASYVITNSFHGTAFSLLYKKRFKVEIEARGRRNIRSEELLNRLKLANRMLTENGIEDIDESVDWGLVDSLLDEEREASTRYLSRIGKKETF